VVLPHYYNSWVAALGLSPYGEEFRAPKPQAIAPFVKNFILTLIP
jgi:hypothetical protein